MYLIKYMQWGFFKKKKITDPKAYTVVYVQTDLTLNIHFSK